MLDTLVRLNGIIDLVMVVTHLYGKISWWTPFNIPDNYVYFALFYGTVKTLYGDSYLSEAVYAVEAIYFGINRHPITAFICALCAIIINLKTTRISHTQCLQSHT